MQRKAIALLGLVALLGLASGPNRAFAIEFESKAKKITFTGRIHTQWNYTSVDGQKVSNEFLVRRLRPALKMQINDWISGVAEVELANNAVELRDAFMRLEPNENVEILLGNAKRRFDLFELTSSTQILVTERAGKIRGVTIPSLSYFTESNLYSDRDTGVFLMLHDKSKRWSVEGSLTNGTGPKSTKANLGKKEFTGRLSGKPVASQPLVLNAGISTRPYDSSVAATADSNRVTYQKAFEVSGEWGNFDSGPHVQAGFVTGDNPGLRFDKVKNESPKFRALQGILTYKHKLAGNKWFESIEPLVRLNYGDPNKDVDKDGGTLITPGVNLFLVSRNRLSLNADIFKPQKTGGKTEVGILAQSWLYW